MEQEKFQLKVIHGSITIAVVLLLSLGTLPISRAQDDVKLARSSERKFAIDYADFAADSAGLVRLEVYYQLFNFALSYEKSGSTYSGGYEISTVVRNSRGDQVDAKTIERDVKVLSERSTRSTTEFRTNVVVLTLPPGKYQIESTLKDKLSRTVYTEQISLKLVPLPGKAPRLSGIEFVQAFTPESGDTTPHFAKGNATVVPSVVRSFTVGDTGRVVYYVEVYPGAEREELLIVESVIRTRSKMVYRDTIHLSQDTQSVIRQLRQVSIDGFAPGTYDLSVTLRGRRYRELDSREKTFSVSLTREALLRHDYDLALQQISYIAEADVIAALRKAVTYEERKRAFDEYWASLDPTPGTVENETRDEFYRRVELSNARFSVMRTDGWRTDRGRVLIRFGEPDQIDDYPYTGDGEAYQIWHYYGQGRYRRFTFRDEIGDGDFRLEFPYDGLNARPDF